MIAIEARIDKRELARIGRMLRRIRGALPRVVRRSLNRSATSGRSRLVKRIAAVIPLKQKMIRAHMRIVRATNRRWQSEIQIRGRGVRLIDLQARQTAHGVTYVADKSAGRELAAHAFIQRMPGGHRGVFRRRGASRLPIEELYGPSLPEIFDTTPGLARETEIDVTETLQKRLDAETKYELEKAARA